MSAVYASMQGLGAALCVIAAVWALRTRHHRRLWRNTRRDASTVAIVLELEEKVRELELEQHPRSTIDVR